MRYLLAADGVVWIVVDGLRFTPTQLRAIVKRARLRDFHNAESGGFGAAQLLELADKADAATYYPIAVLPDDVTRPIVTDPRARARR